MVRAHSAVWWPRSDLIELYRVGLTGALGAVSVPTMRAVGAAIRIPFSGAQRGLVPGGRQG